MVFFVVSHFRDFVMNDLCLFRFIRVRRLSGGKSNNYADIETRVGRNLVVCYLGVRTHSPGVSFLSALDCMDLSQNIGEDNDWGKRFHLGGEVRFPMILSLQAGLNQGYWTGGIGLDFKVLRFDLATYGEEIGDSAGDQVSRRYLAQVTIGW